MPAAAVIPASVAYIKVVAVKKLVVAFLERGTGPTLRWVLGSLSPSLSGPFWYYVIGAFAAHRLL